MARILATTVDPQEHASWKTPTDADLPGYRRAVESFRDIVRATEHLRYAYTLRPTPSGLRFVIDSGAPADLDHDGVIDQASLGEPYYEVDPTLARAVSTGDTLVTPEPCADRWGVFISAFTPIRCADGRIDAILGVDMDATEFQIHIAQMRTSFLFACLEAVVASLMVGGGVALYQGTRQHALCRLAASERRYALAVGASYDGIWDWNLITGEVIVSGRFWELLGYRERPGGEAGVLDLFYGALHPDDHPRLRRAMERHFEDGTAYDIEYRLKTQGGAYRWFHARGQALRDGSGRPVRMVGALRDVTDRVRLQRALRRAARQDRLTGLPNRSALLGRLRRVVRRARQTDRGYALLYLDFDRFKIINDSLGHEAGDELLGAIAARLRTNLRRTDSWLAPALSRTAARLGGDEFVVLLEGVRRREEACAVAERLLAALAEPYTIGGHRVVSTASIGIVTGHARYRRAQDVLRDADTAMYEAKAFRRGTYVVFDEGMRQRAERRLHLEHALREAIATGKLQLLYQPIVCLETGRVLGVEALLRWNHPILGPVSPSEFVPIAEESGMIVELDDWVMEQALDQLARWRQGGSPLGAAGVHVNLSRHHLHVRDLADRWLAATESRGIAPSDVLLEVTENAVDKDDADAIEALEALRTAGFRLAIDDFGVGYSSFASLHRFHFDVLKLDRGFLEGLGLEASRETVVGSIATMAHILGLVVVAEGIETPDQLRLAREMGCDAGQGFLLSRPTSPPAVPHRIALGTHAELAVDGLEPTREDQDGARHGPLPVAKPTPLDPAGTPQTVT